MKKITGLVIILAVLILGGYYGMGVLTEKSIRHTVEIVDQSKGLSAKVGHYDRGLFQSKATIKWDLHVPERVVKDANGQPQTLPAQDYNIDMPLTVNNGPIFTAENHLRFGLGYAQAQFPFPAQYNDQFEAQFSHESVKPQLDLTIFVNYLNDSTVSFQVPTFKLVAKDGSGYFEWLGMNSDTTLTSGIKQVKGHVELMGVNATKDDSKITLGKVTSDYDLHETPAGLYLGDANFSLPSLNVLVKDQKMFELNSFAINSDSDIEQHLFNTHFNVSLKSMFANGQMYGPGVLDVSLRNIDADVLAQINEQTKAFQNGDETQRQQLMMAIIPEFPKLFSKGAELEISQLSLKIPEGQIEGSLYFTIPKGENANPFALLQNIQGQAKLQVPTAAVKEIMKQNVLQQLSKQPDLQQTLIEQLHSQASGQSNQAIPTSEELAAMQTEKQLNALQQAGVIINQGTNYIIEFSLDQGKLTINGKPFDPSMMKF